MENRNDAEGIIVIIAFLVVLVASVRFVTNMISPQKDKDMRIVSNVSSDIYKDDDSTMSEIESTYNKDDNEDNVVPMSETESTYNKDYNKDVEVLENVVLIHTIEYNYLGEVNTIEHDWLIHDEPEYMLDVIEACAAVVDSYFNSNVPTVYYYSSSNDYAYLNSEGSVCLLSPEESSMNDLIVEISLDKVYLYEVFPTEHSKYSDNKSYMPNDIKEKLESLDTSGETISDTNYRSLTEEEFKYIKQICSDYNIDINKSIVEFDITTDTYIVRAEQATVFIELSTGIIDVEYTEHIDY